MLRSICGNMMRWRRRFQRSISSSCGDCPDGRGGGEATSRSPMGLSCAIAGFGALAGKTSSAEIGTDLACFLTRGRLGPGQNGGADKRQVIAPAQGFPGSRHLCAVRLRARPGGTACAGAQRGENSDLRRGQPLRLPLTARRWPDMPSRSGRYFFSYAPARSIISNSSAVKAHCWCLRLTTRSRP
jgi:hypothetical protein